MQFWLLVLAMVPLEGPASAPAKQDQLTIAKTAEDLARGKRLFEAYCARCHGMKGGGGTGANLRRPVLRNAVDDEGLFAVVQDGISGTEMPGNWFLSDREIWQVAGYVRSLGRVAVQAIPGDPSKGKRVFEKAECARCHTIRGKGGSSGPDLTNIGERRGPDVLEEAMLHPGKEMPLNDAGYRAYLVVLLATRDGRLLIGTRINEDTFTIQFRDEKSQLHSWRKRDLEELRKTDSSSMPPYGTMLTRTEIDDLVSFLAQLKGTP
jgi:putative heme-binding domain-containing protein